MAETEAEKYARERVETEQALLGPTSARAAEMDHAAAQQGPVADFKDGFGMTAIAGATRLANEEGPLIQEQLFGTEGEGVGRAVGSVLALTGYRAKEEPFDKDKHFDDLVEGIPYEFHDEIMENDGLESASRARMRIQEDLKRGQRIAQQDTGTLAVLAGSMLDADAPLMLFSGGAYGSAKIAGATMRASRLARLGPKAALRASGVAQGVNAGAQAGLAVGAVDHMTRETTSWVDVANMALMGATLGGGIGAVTKGDVRTSFQAAHNELLERVRKDDPNLTDTLDVEVMAQGSNDGLRYTEQPIPEDGSTVGAKYAPSPTKVYADALVDPNGPIAAADDALIRDGHAWREDSGWQSRKTAADDEWWTKVATSSAGSFSAQFFRDMYVSKSAVANRVAGTIFESPTGLGRGRATSAIRMENYVNRVQQHIDTEPSIKAYAKERQGTWMGSGFGVSQDSRRAFNRELMLERNEIAMGRPGSSTNKHVKRAAQQYERGAAESADILRGRAGEHAVDGFDGVKDKPGYTPQIWKGNTILKLEKAGVVTRANILAALTNSYRLAGMGAGKDAALVAKAVVTRAVAREGDVDTSIVGLLSGDGREWLTKTLEDSGIPQTEIDGLMTRLTGKVEEAGKESFTKARNDVDMAAAIQTQDGSTLQIVDLLDNDMHGVWQRYSRRVAGSGALARNGITNRAQRKQVASAMRAEQRALGEKPTDGDMIAAMFTHFDGGPVSGYSGIEGKTNEGIGTVLATVKRLTNISLLEKLGITQLAETGVTMAQNGVQNWYARGISAEFDKAVKGRNQALLDDIGFITGGIGKDHKHFAPHLDLDDVTDRDKSDWLQKVSKLTSNAQWVQGYTSLFNQVRSIQQTTAALGVADKVMRTLKESAETGTPIDATVAKRFETDLGIFPEDIKELQKLIADGTVQFRTQGKQTFVDALNMDTWSVDLAEAFGASIMRNVNQLVQKSMAGEQDAWIHTQWGAMLTHLKTFPMQAVQKQVLRNARHVDMQSLTTLMYGLATASVAVRVRDALDGKDRTEAEYAKAAFNYSNMTGFVPMVADPILTIVGLEDHRFNKYGPYSSVTPAMFSVADDMRRVPGALWHTAAGQGDYYDEKALKAIPFAGTIGISRAFD